MKNFLELQTKVWRLLETRMFVTEIHKQGIFTMHIGSTESYQMANLAPLDHNT